MSMGNVWIGLNNLTGQLLWSDGSQFDFASDISGGVYPWNSNANKNDYEPNNYDGEEKCTHIWTRYGSLNDDHCYGKFMFMCNDCGGKVNKYVSINDEERNFVDSEAFCNEKFGTSLASVHDQYDQALVEGVCKLVDTAKEQYGDDCWIGATDAAVEDQWVWTDGTHFDFGEDLSGSVWPWGQNGALNEPNNNNGNEDCVELRSAHEFDWNDQLCGPGTRQYFVCNLPSEICKRFRGNWTILSGDIYWNTYHDCMVHSDIHSMSVIENKIWTMSNETWIVIDYMFTAHNVANNIGKAGVVIYVDNMNCGYYYVGMSVDSFDGDTKIFMERHFNNSIQSIFEGSTNMYIYDRYYKFRIELKYNTTFNNFLWSINFIDFEDSFQADSSLLDYMGSSNVHVGMRNDAMNISAKSLYISAPYDFITNGDIIWNQCTPSPTADPTTDPTVDPTTDPTNDPTIDPTNNPTQQPTDQPSIDPTHHPTIDPTKTPTSDPTIDPTFDPTLNPTKNPIIHPTSDPSIEPTVQPTATPLNDGEFIEITPSPIQISTAAVIVDGPRLEENLELYFYFGVGIVILLICIIVLLILIYRRYYMQDTERELIKNTSVVQTDSIMSHQTHYNSNITSSPKMQNAKLKINNGVQQNMDSIGMTEIITIGGMNMNQMIKQMDQVDVITTAGDLDDDQNREYHRQFKSEDMYNQTDEDRNQDGSQDNNDQDVEEMYSNNNSPITPGFPRVVTDPGLNQQFKLSMTGV